MGTILKFGDVFFFDDKEYVFLGFSAANEILYAARILERDLTIQILAHERSANKHPGRATNLLYCFVVLTTDEFTERMVHFARTDNSEVRVRGYIGSLTDIDRQAIRDELMEAPVPTLLKEIIEQTTDDTGRPLQT